MKPLIVINFKTYKEAAGKNALNLARELAKVNPDHYELVVTPSFLTLKEIIEKTNLTVYAQHVDIFSYGAHTGAVPLDEIKSIGVKGTILNHSENKLRLDRLKGTIEACKKNKIKTIVCASTLSEIKKIAYFHPDYIAYEPKELIGGNISVTEAKPDLILKAIDLIKSISPKIKFLCGAGIHNKEDLGHALLLGAHGVLIGHAVARAKDPKKFLKEMLI